MVQGRGGVSRRLTTPEANLELVMRMTSREICRKTSGRRNDLVGSLDLRVLESSLDGEKVYITSQHNVMGAKTIRDGLLADEKFQMLILCRAFL